MKPRYIFAMSLILLVVGIFLYRNNAMDAQKQAESIVKLDGQSIPVVKRLASLEKFVKNHMNTSTDLALSGSYGRAVLAAQAAAQQTTQAGAKVYADAEANCSAKVDSIQLSNCVTAYIASHALPEQIKPQPATVEEAPYLYTFTAPIWSWDLAGITLALSAISFVITVALLVLPVPKRSRII